MWTATVGLVNNQHKYLTAETFGHKINANGVTLKKKQQWTIEPFPINANGSDYSNGNRLDDLDELENIAIKSHLNCYLAVDSFGNVTCESPDKTEGSRFTITICSMSSSTTPGQPQQEQISWAFRNVSRGYYLGTTGDGMIQCNAKMPQSRAELWHVHLIPARGASMFAIKSIGRKRYARAISANSGQINGASNDSDNSEQIQVDSTNAWGSETLFQFKYFEGGKYALLTSSSRYLTNEGTCVDPNKSSITPMPPIECLFTIEYHCGNIAFRDNAGRYLAAAGRASLLRSRSTHVTKDEQFEFEMAPIQVALRATFNNKWVSTKQGVDLSANQNELTKQETFQFEYNSIDNSWYITTFDGHYWALGGASTIQTSKDFTTKTSFKLKWNPEDGSCSLAVNDGKGGDESSIKWIGARKSGQLFTCTSDSAVKFFMKFLNRTSINLRASNASGFVGLKLPGSGKLESNKTTPDSIRIEYANSDNNGLDFSDIDLTFNCCYLKMMSNNKYLSLIENNCLAADASSAACGQQFQTELRNGTQIAIKTFESNSNYLNLTKNGSIVVSNCLPESATLWEF
ncbi:protein singed-like [Oppia nitens]|uniref:protein singed-like n=1 Tax=Oppia nitens TaxID=1686743 RepID=UPI0023DB3CD3|nr:protein singed-like [Oppia nitens]